MRLFKKYNFILFYFILFEQGYNRKGTALYLLGKLEEACEAYQEGLKHEPNNAQLKKSLEEAESALAKSKLNKKLYSKFFALHATFLQLS